MKLRDTLVTLLALAAIGLTSYFAYRRETRSDPNLCNICGRQIHPGMSFVVETDGRAEHACCPRCGMHFALSHHGKAQKLRATDMNSGKLIPAETAYYDEGGNINHCAAHGEAVERQPQGVSVRDYDRCLPTLVAFQTRAEAETYQKEHGGRVLSYSEALQSVRD
jgi:ribosomal protein L24E